MGLSLADVLADYRYSLNEAASAFPGTPAGDGDVPPADPDADLKRHLRTAAAAISRDKRPRTMLGELTVVADQSEYTDVPADLYLPKVAAWGRSGLAPWNLPRPPLPTIMLAENADGRVLTLTPAPRTDQITAFGSRYPFYYLALHEIGDSTGTLPESDRNLLILRAQVEAMRELSFRNHNKPVTLRGGAGIGGSVSSKNTTPPALWAQLMQEYRESA